MRNGLVNTGAQRELEGPLLSMGRQTCALSI